jgi:lipopolysaccharide export system permease protein
MIKLIDRYLLKQFLQTLFFALVTFIAIFVVVDMMENMGDFIDRNIPSALIFEYYIYFIPDIIKLMFPIAILLSGMFTAGKMSTQNELAALKAGGVSLYRFMLPFLITVFFLSIFSVYFGGYIVPKAVKAKIAFETKYMKRSSDLAGNDIFFQDSRTRIINISYFDDTRLQANRASIQEFAPDNITRMVSRTDAGRLKYSTHKKMWEAYNGIRRHFGNSSEEAVKFDSLELPELNFLPKDVLAKQQQPEEMNLGELKELYETQNRSGNDPTRTLIEFHSRIAFAFANFIVIFFGLPLSANKRKGGLALQFGISLLMTFLYLGFMKISQAFGNNGAMNPMLTAWFANIVFLAAALLNIVRAPK